MSSTDKQDHAGPSLSLLPSAQDGAVRALRLLPWVTLALLAAGCASQNPQGSRLHTTDYSPDYQISGYPPSGLIASALHHFYQSWAGTPYRYGGTTKRGVDCSSFVRQAVYATESRRLPRTTVAQARMGRRVPRSQLRVGDLVFFKTGARSHHVGIYIGHGRFMHASDIKGVTISRLDNVYWRHHYWQARRLPGNWLSSNNM